jgi:hypothetical protein
VADLYGPTAGRAVGQRRREGRVCDSKALAGGGDRHTATANSVGCVVEASDDSGLSARR